VVFALQAISAPGRHPEHYDGELILAAGTLAGRNRLLLRDGTPPEGASTAGRNASKIKSKEFYPCAAVVFLSRLVQRGFSAVSWSGCLMSPALTAAEAIQDRYCPAGACLGPISGSKLPGLLPATSSGIATCAAQPTPHCGINPQYKVCSAALSNRYW
jgi:hypothetical protein